MTRKPQKGKSLAEVNPELANQWHLTKNGDLTAFDVSIKHSAKVWWKCPQGDDHEWFTSVNERNRGRGCSICSGKKIVLSTCLETINPEVAREWHPTKNGDLSPLDVSPGSNKKVWWKCKEEKHPAWKTSIAHRNNGTNCSFCSGTNKKDTNWFIEKSKSIYGDKFDYSNAVYINAKTEIEIRCVKHNNIFHQVSNNHFIQPYACEDCLVEYKRSLYSDSKKEFEKKSIKVFGDIYDYSDVVYINQKTKVTLRCKKHNLKFEQTPSMFLQGVGCSQCSKETIDSKRSDETLIKIRNYVKKLEGKCLSEEYNTNEKNLQFECKYGHQFKESWSDVKNSLRWCPKCSKNRLIGESIARQIMEHALQFEFPSVYIKEMEGLQLDGYNAKNKIAFEYQGYQHYSKQSHFHTTTLQFKSQKYRDNEKKRLCKKNGIKLIEIFEFDTIRKSRIKKFYSDVCELLLKKGFILNTSPFDLDLIDLYRGKESGNYIKAKEIVEKNGGKIQEYIGSLSHHVYTCKYSHNVRGKVLKSIISSIASCPECEDIQYLDRLKDSVVKRGGLLHEDKWKGVHAYYNWECDEGHHNKSKGGNLLRSWCIKCQKIDSVIRFNHKKLNEFRKDCESGKYYQPELLKRYNISYSPFMRIIKENNIQINYKPQQNKGKSKGEILQLHPTTLEIIKEYPNLESIIKDSSNNFGGSISYQMKRFKKSYGFYWCRKDYYKDFIKTVKNNS